MPRYLFTRLRTALLVAGSACMASACGGGDAYFAFGTGGFTLVTGDFGTAACSPSFSAQQALAAVNAARAVGRSCGGNFFPPAPPLAWNAVLARAAERQAVDMAAGDFLSHAGRDGSNPGQRIDAAGYDWATYGENVAAGRASLDATLADWLASPAHCANLMEPRFRDMGLACASRAGTRYGSYWAQVFAAPR